MKIFSLIMTTLIVSAGLAQPVWTINHNNKVLLKIKTEDESKNVLNIKKTEFDKKGNLVISYIKQKDDASWNRSLIIGDSTLESHVAKQNKTTVTFTIPNATIKSLLKKGNKLVLYTLSIPSDPTLAASVRVRRVHLCTIWLK